MNLGELIFFSYGIEQEFVRYSLDRTLIKLEKV